MTKELGNKIDLTSFKKSCSTIPSIVDKVKDELIKVLTPIKTEEDLISMLNTIKSAHYSLKNVIPVSIDNAETGIKKAKHFITETEDDYV